MTAEQLVARARRTAEALQARRTEVLFVVAGGDRTAVAFGMLAGVDGVRLTAG